MKNEYFNDEFDKELENIKISDELLRNNNIFVSDIIKNEHIKFDVLIEFY